MESLILESASSGLAGVSCPEPNVPERPLAGLLPATMLRTEPPELPCTTELEVVRHFTRLSQLNCSIDTAFYPLGSCTMKYNPKVNEDAARLEGFTDLHPHQPWHQVQGALRLMRDLERYLGSIAGLPHVCLQPAAGAQGELTGILVIKAYHNALASHGRSTKRTKILVPDSAHGTNPATAAMAGFEVVTVASNERGLVSVPSLKANLDETVAALMLTNPNTLGLFEEEILDIRNLVHSAGGLLYYDGANLNAILGAVRPGDMGFDVVHMNLHKTFSTPHGGGGPGAGPVAVSDALAPFLPVPRIVRVKDHLELDFDAPASIGRVKAFFGNFGTLVRAYTYIYALGGPGLVQASQDAVLNANYLKARLSERFEVPYPQHCMHEFVLSGNRQKQQGASTLAMAKRLIDYGMHPPTIYFPLIVPEAMMIEPTETEGKPALDRFVEIMETIAAEVEADPAMVNLAPHHAPVGRVDEVLAARKPDLRWARHEAG